MDGITAKLLGVCFALFYLDVGNKDICCGCRACEMICPTNCIKMAEDNEGFLYPFRNYNFCINCGLCEKVCPFMQKQKIELNTQGYLPKAFLAIHKDERVVFRSSSGGVFLLL